MNAPMIREWELYFKEKDGYENRLAVVKSFTDFWESNMDELKIPGKYMLGGKVFNRDGFQDGDEIFTSTVKSIKRVESGEKHGAAHDLLCATTASGSKYYFYSDEYNAYMILMMGDMVHRGKLHPGRGNYVKREFRNLDLL